VRQSITTRSSRAGRHHHQRRADPFRNERSNWGAVQTAPLFHALDTWVILRHES